MPVPYAEYRPTGEVWCPEVPSGWSFVPARGLFREINDTEHPDDQMLSVTIERGIIPQTKLLENSSKKDGSNLDRSKYKRVAPGDIAYNKMRAWQGAFGLSAYQGIISPAYVVERPISGVGRYWHLLFRTAGFSKECERWSYGIASDMWSLRPEHFKGIHLPVPPMDEQRAIVKYLGHAHARVDRAIASRRKLIALLEEHKQAVITQAVTKGLDPSVPMKDSGIPWVGVTPLGWTTRPLKDLAVVQSGVTLNSARPSTGGRDYPYLRVANVQAGRLELDEITSIHLPAAEAERYLLRPGDLLMTEGGDIDKLGRSAQWHGEIEDCLHQNHLFAVRCGSGMKPEFLSYVLASSVGRVYFQRTGKQTTNLASTNKTTLGAFSLAVPSLAEQQAIVAHIDAKNAAADKAIAAYRRQIDLLTEYKQRLTSDVVTGQVDVREAAAALPDLPLEDLPDASDLEAEADDEVGLEDDED